MWRYHQFCMESTQRLVWDGNIQFHRPNSYRLAVIGMLREPDYRDNLVQRYFFVDDTGQTIPEYDPSFYWCPPPTVGFIPTVTAAPLA